MLYDIGGEYFQIYFEMFFLMLYDIGGEYCQIHFERFFYCCMT